ncbi:MAG: MarR family transcriptional regulator [Deltaproteobacteria bacterium]|nr:MarR family transcriptional regulator [Deltaproteobacteria bacterium]
MDYINPQNCPYYLISRTTLVVTSALKKGLAAAGVDHVKPAYLGVLMSLWENNGLKVIELGRRAGLEPSTMTGLLDRMERDGLLKRSSDPVDRRVLRINLTTEGRNVRKAVHMAVDQILKNVFEIVSNEDMDHLKQTLRDVLASMQGALPE